MLRQACLTLRFTFCVTVSEFFGLSFCASWIAGWDTPAVVADAGAPFTVTAKHAAAAQIARYRIALSPACGCSGSSEAQGRRNPRAQRRPGSKVPLSPGRRVKLHKR